MKNNRGKNKLSSMKSIFVVSLFHKTVAKSLNRYKITSGRKMENPMAMTPVSGGPIWPEGKSSSAILG